MPTYAYRCPNGHDFDRFYKTISASEAEVACPECGEKASRQLSGGAGLMFKGSGFYLTDYGKNAHRGVGAAKPSGGNEGAAKSETPKAESAKPKSESPKAESQPVKPKPKSE